MGAVDRQVTPVAASAPAAVPSYTFDALQKMAASMAKSGMFGFKDEAQALSLLLISQAEGRHPALAARDFHVIQNRPALKADTLLARFQESGGSVKWTEYTDARVCGIFSHPQGGSLTVDWDTARAKQAKLADKDNWKNYPRAMLKARCISEAVRALFPGVAVGIYTPEELQDGGAEIGVTPISTNQAVSDVATEKRTGALSEEDIEKCIDAMNNAADLEELAAAYSSAQAFGKTAGDKAALAKFAKVKDLRKEWLAKESGS